jgi:hypothetical protein
MGTRTLAVIAVIGAVVVALLAREAMRTEPAPTTPVTAAAPPAAQDKSGN